jgi:hypothetical protein
VGSNPSLPLSVHPKSAGDAQDRPVLLESTSTLTQDTVFCDQPQLAVGK